MRRPAFSRRGQRCDEERSVREMRPLEGDAAQLAMKMEEGPMPRNADGKEGEQESCWAAEPYMRDHCPRRPEKAKS